MSDTQVEEEKRRWDFLAREYPIIESKWRFLQGLRYAIFGGLVAVLGSLFAVYVAVLNVPNTSQFPTVLVGPVLTGIATMALMLIFAGSRLERRLRAMYTECSNRGATLELLFENPDGVFNKLETVPRTKYIDHTQSVRLVAVFISFGWLLLTLYGLLRIGGVP